MSEKERRKCKFNIELQNTFYMFETTANEHEAFCKICKQTISLANKGRISLERHIISEKHIRKSENEGCEPPIIDAVVYSSESEATDDGFNSTNDNPLENSSELESNNKKHIDHKPFSPFWLGKDWSKGWLAPYPEDRYKAKCLSCKKVLKAGKSELVKHSKTYQHQKSFNNFKSTMDSQTEYKEKIFTNNGVTVRAKLEKGADERNRITITKIDNNDSIPPNIETIYVPTDSNGINNVLPKSQNSIPKPIQPEKSFNSERQCFSKDMFLLRKRKMELENENLVLQNEGLMLKNRRLQLEIIKMEKELGFQTEQAIETTIQEQNMNNEEAVVHDVEYY